jgi:4-hydroxybenzoate polyprenyltransferase
MAVSRGLLPFIAVWSAFAYPFELKPWLLGSIAFLWVFAFQVTKDIPDVEGDRMYGIRTLPVVYGVKKTVSFVKWASLLPFLPLALYIWLGMLPHQYLLLLSLVAVRQVGVWGFERKTEILENTISWNMFYIGLGLIFILAGVVEIWRF